MKTKTFCKNCNYEFTFRKRVHNPEYCTCGACMVDWCTGSDNLWRFAGEFRFEEINEPEPIIEELKKRMGVNE